MADREPRDEREQRPRTNDHSRGNDARSSSHSGASRGAPHRSRSDAGARPSTAGGKKPYGKSDDRKPYGKPGEKKPYGKSDDRKPYGKSGDRKPYGKPGEKKPYGMSDDRKPYGKSDDRKPYGKPGEKKPYAKSDDRKPYGRPDDRKPYAASGDRKPYGNPAEKKPYVKREGDRPYVKREGDRPYAKREGDRPYAKREGSYSDRPRQDRPTRGGAGRPDRATRPEEIRAVRPRHDDPFVPDEVTAQDLNGGARNELKTLSKENADWVARHLAMAANLIDDEPELAHQHALSASRRAGRIAIVRETLAITAYATGDYALALRELRTYRRISGRDDQIALMVDSERGIGRPDRALEAGRAVDRSILPVPVRVELAIAMSGARLDQGEPERALAELEIPEFDAERAYEWSPALFAARAAVLEELGRDDEARDWQRRAVIAADALDEASGAGDLEVIEIEEVVEIPLEDEGDLADEGGLDDEGDVQVDAGAEPADATSDVEAPVTIDDEVREILEEAGVDEPEEPPADPSDEEDRA